MWRWLSAEVTTEGALPAVVDLERLKEEGNHHRDGRRWDTAAASYRTYLDIVPADWPIIVQLGHCLKESGGLDEALRLYRKAELIAPDDQDLKVHISHALMLLGRATDAPANCTSNITWQNPDGLVRRADELRDRGQFQEAAGAYAAAIVLAPTRLDLRVQRANMLKDAERYEDAEALYLECAEAAPTDADIRVQLAHVYKLTGRRREANAAYREALKIDPKNAAARRELRIAGDLEAQSLDLEEALRAGSVGTLLHISRRLDTVLEEVQAMRAALPEAASSLAFPIDNWGTMRAIFDCPAPSSVCSAVSISVVQIVDNESAAQFLDQLAGLRAQSHSNWIALILLTVPALEPLAARAAAADYRITWRTVEPAEAEPIALSTLCGSSADYVLALARGDILHSKALAWFAEAMDIAAVDAIFCDEEILQDNAQSQPVPVFRSSPDIFALMQAPLAGDTIFARPAAFVELTSEGTPEAATSWRTQFWLRMSAFDRAAHLPLPLVRRVALPEHEAWRRAAHRRGAEKFLKETGLDRTLTLHEPQRPKDPLRLDARPNEPFAPIAVVIPTKDNPGDLAAMVNSLFAQARHPEILHLHIMHNGPSAARSAEIEQIAQNPCVTIEDIEEPFNWSRLNNRAVTSLGEPLIVFANDDMEMLSAGWDDRLRGLLQLETVGAVGAKLLYPDCTVQHAGIMFGWNRGAIHDGLHRDGDDPGPQQRWRLTRQASAVTGAFLALRRAVFLEIGGFDEQELPVAYSDVELCIKLAEGGRTVLWCPEIVLTHRESKTRGLDHKDPRSEARADLERRTVRARWPRFDFEPTVNPWYCAFPYPLQLLQTPSSKRVIEYLQSARAFRVSQMDFGAAVFQAKISKNSE